MFDQSELKHYVLIDREMDDEGIMAKPPLYLKLWVWLLLTVQHEEYKNLNRCELITSVAAIREAMAWYVGCRKVKPSANQIRSALKWLKNTSKGGMIIITPTRDLRGNMIIRVFESGRCHIPDNCEV